MNYMALFFDVHLDYVLADGLAGALLQSPGPQKPQPESCEHTTAPSLFAS